MKKRVHLVCNAHLDPVWLWEWEEGAAEAISTFRTAAELCEKNPGFVFNHNEVTLYKWVEEYEPELFERIRKLVRKKRWHIMGSWYLQPDCNMPSAESFIRQILYGRKYFRAKFGAYPTTAINFDPFGHSRGLVQIMAKSGFDSYLFGRPGPDDIDLPADTFRWIGFDGSEVLATRFQKGYLSALGKAREKIETFIGDNPNVVIGTVLWGVGNHGGGPSKIDIARVNALIAETADIEIVHSTPEDFFRDVRKRRHELPIRKDDLNPWAVGCYTSQIRIKQLHRSLENELFAVEKMCSAASANRLMTYPHEEIAAATEDLLAAEFHDVLPGSSIQPVENASLRLMDHGLEILSRIRARAFFALATGQPPAKTDEIPILVYNPHPFRIKTVVECEFNLADQNRAGDFTLPEVYRKGVKLPCQVEKEQSNLDLDWRKRVAFTTVLEPSQMNRFDCRLRRIAHRPQAELAAKNGRIVFDNGAMKFTVDTRTGLVETYEVGGRKILAKNAFAPVVFRDDADPWGMLTHGYVKRAGAFRLMTPGAGTSFSAVDEKIIPSVRVVEDGPARSVIEAVFTFNRSDICQRYKLPKHGSEVEIETRVHWNEKDRMLKLLLPFADPATAFLGQTAGGVQALPTNGDEAVAQKWVAVVAEKSQTALTCISTGTYGFSLLRNSLCLTLLRSPAYAAHPVGNTHLVPQDRYTPRIDQGERLFTFRINGGKSDERLRVIEREALAANEKPFALSFFPRGGGKKPKPLAELTDATVVIQALKPAEDKNGYIVRLYEPTGRAHQTRLKLPALGVAETIALAPFEIKTFRIRPGRRPVETDLMENKL